MQLIIPPEITSQLVDGLTQAGRREIGGILMGEHVGPDTFRVRELTVQRKGGTFAAFVRIVSEVLAPLCAFFDATKHDYTRFNYLGEWHSHHSFALEPSGQDHMTMCDMVMDPQLGAHFVVLLLVKLNGSSQIEGNVIVYEPNKTPFPGTVVQEETPPSSKN
jgi:[CysO sulfur-carrier protein]-S-L-cysteine hydrolase